MSKLSLGSESACEVAFLVIQVSQPPIPVRVDHVVEGDHAVEAGARHNRRPHRLSLKFIEPVGHP